MNYLGIFVGVFTLAFLWVCVLDEIANYFNHKLAQRRSADTASAPARPDAESRSAFGAELPTFDWPERSNVYPIHHRRSMAHPHLRAVPDTTDAA